MYGVILWRSAQENRAVIWCEDHADLAFFDGGLGSEGDLSGVEPNDLVKIELRTEGGVRLARNLKLVAKNEYPTLTRQLKEFRPSGIAAVPM